jgi:ornithine cyclodeaminase
LPSTQALCIDFDAETGRPRAVIDGAALTARRTGAASGLATELLARRDARIGAVVGCGAIGREHVLALDSVRRLDEIRIAARRPDRAARCAEEMQGEVRARLVPCASVTDASADADVICTATTANEPVLRAAHLADGCHINTVGSFRLDMRELAVDVFARACVFVDHVDAVCAEAGHLVAAVLSGVTAPSAWTALGDVVRGGAAGRADDGVLTVFVSVGQAAQDVAAAARIVEVARAEGLGTEVDLT